MSKIAIVYWSGTGNTEEMAKAIAIGVTDAGSESSIFTSSEFNSGKLSEFDAVAFGCPAMGAEELEESEFEPMFSELESSLNGKKIALFGSYGWGDGEWMRSWEERCRTAGANLVSDFVICNESPDDAAVIACKKLGSDLTI
jgi:flavodoxin, short chain